MSAAPASPHSHPARTRDPRIDTLRGILIILVVFGHVTLRFVTRSSAFELVYWWTYLVHMPGFAFLSGIVVRDPGRSARGAVRALLPVYLGFSLLHIGMRAIEATGGRIILEPLWAPGLHWYLLSLLVWRLVLPHALRYRRGLVLTLSIGAALLIGFAGWAGPFLSISRTVVFWPFFYAGHLLGLEGFTRLGDRLRGWAGVLALLVYALIGIGLCAGDGFRISQLTGKLPYSETSDHWIYALVVRAAVLVCTALVILAGASLLPIRSSVLSRIGEDSMPVYLLHLYLVYPLDHVAERIDSRPLMAAIILGLTALAVALTHTRIASRFVASYSALCRRVFDAIANAARDPGGRRDTVGA